MGLDRIRSCLAGASLLIAVTSPVYSGVQPSTHADQLVVEVWLQAPSQLQTLREYYDVWARNHHSGGWWVRLPASELSRLESLNIAYAIDHRRTAELQTAWPRTAAGAETIGGFPCYRTVERTLADMATLAATHPELAELRDIGDSWRKTVAQGGDDILALVLSNRELAGPKPALVIAAAIHAREYATAELAMRFAEDLLNGYGVDADATWLLDEYAIHIVPQLNPDGRAVAEQSDTRFKRKNDDAGFCSGDVLGRGIDLNRNSTVLWGGGGTSTSQCSDIYRGPTPASEPETLAIENYLSTVFTDQRPGAADNLTIPAADASEGLFISLHSFSELVLFPWEGVSDNSGNHSGLRTLARKLAFYNGYFACQDCLGVAAGTTVDYAYGEFGVAAYTFEIGTSFFQSCASFNASVLPDNLAALRYAAKAARRPYQQGATPEAVELSLSAASVDQGVAVELGAQISDARRRTQSDDGGEPGDNIHPVSGAYYTIDIPEWRGATLIPMQPQDGLFDSVTETVTASIDTAALTVGRHRLFVYGEDSDGIGVPSAIFLEVLNNEQLFADGFENSF
ncbi:MAG: hypothetical protein Tsb002_38710 [Wenzhouxiangellaceae bacterium]